MKGLAVLATITLSFALCIPAAIARKSNTVVVQLYGDLLEVDEKTPDFPKRTAFLILPDGSHAEAFCFGNCKIESFPAEKRVTIPCQLLKADATKYAHCYRSESYEAVRKGNDITLQTVNGKVTYHIVGSW